MRLKRLRDQTIVVTGASTGIGLAVARQAARAGARLVLVSTDEDKLRELVGELSDRGVPAIAVPADVADAAAVEGVAARAVARFGGFDTWICGAGVAVYGRSLDVPVEEERRLFETSYWGVVNGCRTAARHLRESGGAIVNVVGVASGRAMPRRAAYCASKAAVHAYTDSLRTELAHGGAPVSVTLVEAAAIDASLCEAAGSRTGNQPAPPSSDDMNAVARAILGCAEKPVRQITVEGGGRLTVAAGPARQHQEDGDLRDPRQRRVAHRVARIGTALSKISRALPLLAMGIAVGFGLRRGGD